MIRRRSGKKAQGNLNNAAGTSLVETSVCLATLFTACTLGLSSIYIGSARFWLNQQLYNSLLCLSRGETTFKCRQEFLVRSRQVLRWGRLEAPVFRRTANSFSVTTEWQVSQYRLHLKKTLPRKDVEWSF